ncbi:hypothetical protein BTA51_13465 [Hahella sp. CCB-MM4]|uniref:hypothetical protein n=1 Tax=Hahella sp. (strain CCB-MM4) TaxID=1926491 RepID=UPI000B9AF5E7|nr:hypothetical protein [Hahella sp. CCB-MM4]OZG72962.1 hypothetical protein BTA51_13465 [Hahella sp. CCB-MM4]
MKIIGNKEAVALGIGNFWEGSKQQQEIQTWLDNRHLTEFDSIVYLPTFYTHLEREIQKLKGNSFYQKDFVGTNDDRIFEIFDLADNDFHKVLCYDITTCSASCYFYNNGTEDRIVYSFWDPRHEPQSEIGKVYGLTIDKPYLIEVLSNTLSELSTDWT